MFMGGRAFVGALVTFYIRERQMTIKFGFRLRLQAGLIKQEATSKV